ncbi:MAG: RNA polymerase factor sigma-54 [Gammaproteobacteria bacterium]|nr:RNA polymerase factor sigma-54 [Gammaproteobacteria bacterium]
MMKPSLQLRIGQSLTMTPQLQQAIRLLQMPVMELQTQIEEALESNLMLETVEEENTETKTQESANAQEAATPDNDAEGDRPEAAEATYEETWERQITAAEPNYNSSGGEPPLNQEFVDQSGETLQEHLLWQLELEKFNPEETLIGRAIIDAINDDGYMMDEFASIRETVGGELQVTDADIEAVLKKIQRLDPAGVGARDLSECLDLQLQQLANDTDERELARELVRNHLDMLAERDFAGLRRNLNVPDEALEIAVALVKSLNPHPGAAVNTTPPTYLIPDVYVKKIDGVWAVEINASSAPGLRVNQVYAKQLARGSEHSILRSQLQEARWLVRSLEIRNETIFKVASCIVARQQGFLESGDEAMTPMILRDVAEELDMHESTISRVTTNKYMHTPRGIFEFRYFFSSHIGTQSGDELSSIAIRAKIRKLINEEVEQKPLSDIKIARKLQDQGIKVARRTVAKYRESMNIPSSSERKKIALRH